MPITLSVTLDEAVALCNIVGQLPTQTNAYPLWQKLRAQVEPLVPKDPSPEAAD